MGISLIGLIQQRKCLSTFHLCDKIWIYRWLLRFLVGVLLLPQPSIAATDEKEAFCSQASNLEFFKDRLEDTNFRLGFQNPAEGFLNFPTGLCWWHSRFQRSVSHLVIFRELKPGESEMTTKELKRAIHRIRKMNNVVEIRTNRYQNFAEWSWANKDLIHKKLKSWQGWELLHGVIGLEGNSTEDPIKLKFMMDELYKEVESTNSLVYQMLQLKGPAAHAWLVIRMSKYKNRSGEPLGYKIYIVDSNFPLQTMEFDYRYGQTHFNYPGWGKFVPYTQRERELRKILGSVLRSCRPAKANMMSRTNILYKNMMRIQTLQESLKSPNNFSMKYPEEGKTYEDIVAENILKDEFEVTNESWSKLMTE